MKSTFLHLSLSLLLIIFFASCGGSSSSSSSNNNNNPPPTNTTNPDNNNNQSTSNNTNQNNNTNITDGNFSMGDDYILPPMPGIFEKNKDLLGIDTNNNQVRDDVEHYIYNRFQGYKNSRVEREIAMQWARIAQLVIQNPETAYEDKKYELTDRTLGCQWYYYNTYLENIEDYATGLRFRIQHDIFNDEFKDIIFNTRERLKAYFRYNEDMSGHVFSLGTDTKDNCDFDADLLIEGRL